MWTNSVYRCAGVHFAMTTCASSRVRRDNEDLETLPEWYTVDNPINPFPERSLKSLSSGEVQSMKGSKHIRMTLLAFL
jgi:hypothetical protein